MFFLLAGFCNLIQANPVQQNNERPFVVVIDAGHGGTDPGAIGAKAQEKDLNLAVTLLAGKLIKAAYPEVQVLYTRETDVFIPLQKRADFVNKNNANLFICVHTNSSPVAAAKGAETFVLGTDRLDKNLDVAMRENAVIKLEADYQTAYHGFDPNSIDSYIMFELMQNQYLDQSLNYATYLQQYFANTLKRGDRGVRQAAFWVLLKSACPSVLVEMGFISNPEEEKFLISDSGQNQIAKAICDAFASFYRKTGTLKVDTTSVFVPEEKPVISEQVETPQVTQPVATTQTTPPATTVQTLFAVQIFATHEKLAENDSRFNGLVGCKYIKIGEWYKYYYGATADREEAFRLSQELQKKFPGCFVIKL
jgi:N-acetylmuramoyl-L-alanine amidase